MHERGRRWPPAPPPTEPVSYRRADYAYALPGELVARRPAAARDQARLLVLRRTAAAPAAGLEHARFATLPRYLRAGDCLVLNETRVVPARLRGRRRGSGGALELLLLARRQAASGAASAVGPEAAGGSGAAERAAGAAAPEPAVFEAIVRPARRLRPGVAFTLEDGALEGEVLALGEGGRRLVGLRAATGGGPEAVERLVEQVGHMPIPPYLGRHDDQRDRTDYQTVFARVPGAVAAPTAGLHFTRMLLAGLESAGVRIARLVLHVGPGTFQPVTVADLRDHRLPPERFSLPAAAAACINATRAAGGRVVAVGTTVVRTLETQARRAAPGETVAAGGGEADLFIHPPFTFRAVDAMITNFHLPESTLLMLVAAFAGRERILATYAEAVRVGYRFYSYGDAQLIL